MAATVASRYAVLSLDEDDDYSNRKKKPPSKKSTDTKPSNVTSVKSDTNFKKKKKNNLQSNQNVKTKNKATNDNGNSKKKKEASAEQWEEWKQKDSQFVEGNYEDELSQAILLSKLDYEEKKHFYESGKKSGGGEQQKKNSKKNKKNQTKVPANETKSDVQMSGGESPAKVMNFGKKSQKIKSDRDLTEQMKETKVLELQCNVGDKVQVLKTISHEALTLAQYEDTLEKKDKEISQLKEEVEKLKGQLDNVKNRNKKLCQIIANGEMKDKAEVLMEVERLQTVRDELSSEVVNLHAQLEQERSKVRALSGNEHKAKDKNRKRHATQSECAQ